MTIYKYDAFLKSDKVAGLSPTARRVLNGLVLVADENRDSFTCKQIEITKAAGVGQRMFRTGLRELEAEGIVSRMKSDFGTPYTYVLNTD